MIEALRPFTPRSITGAGDMTSQLNQNGEQAGAGQPATTPESKPESKEKPQPESKPAPR